MDKTIVFILLYFDFEKEEFGEHFLKFTIEMNEYNSDFITLHTSL